MELIDHRIVGLIKTTVNWLVSGDYTAIERRSCGVRLKADDLREAVQTYGRTLRALPESAYTEIDAIKVNRIPNLSSWALRPERETLLKSEPLGSDWQNDMTVPILNRGLTMKTPDICHDRYTCCDCGGNDCGCGYCFSCNACDYCNSGEGEHCEMVSDDEFCRLTDAQKKAIAYES